MKPEYIVIHHSFTEDRVLLNDYEAIERYHVEEKGWKSIGYHYVVEMVDGKPVTQAGRRVGDVGAHCRHAGMNRRGVGVCVVGNFDLEPPAFDVLKEVIWLLWALRVNLKLGADRIIGHREAGLMDGYDWRKGEFKTCPGARLDMDLLRRMAGGG